MQIDKEKLKQILDKQYTDCLKHIIMQAESKIQELSDYGGDMLDIKTEITIGHSMENKICQTSYADYYNKDSIVSVPRGIGDQPYSPEAIVKDSVPEAGKIPLDKLFWPERGALWTGTETNKEQQFTQQELKQLLDMIVSLMLYVRQAGGPMAPEIKTIYTKILGLL